MDLEQLPEAVEALSVALRSFRPFKAALTFVLTEFDVTEAAVRARFEAHFRVTPEEFARRHDESRSIETCLRKFREVAGVRATLLRHHGERFYVVAEAENGRVAKHWHRVLVDKGTVIECVNETTQVRAEFRDSILMDQIRSQIGVEKSRLNRIRYP